MADGLHQTEKGKKASLPPAMLEQSHHGVLVWPLGQAFPFTFVGRTPCSRGLLSPSHWASSDGAARGETVSQTLPAPSRRSKSALHPEPGARPPPANAGGETGGETDCFRNRIYRTSFTRDVSGAAKLSSNRQGSGTGGSELEPLDPSGSRAPARGGGMSQGSRGPREGPESARRSGQPRRSPREKGPGRAPAGTRKRGERAKAPESLPDARGFQRWVVTRPPEHTLGQSSAFSSSHKLL